MIPAPEPALYRILTVILAALVAASIVRFIGLRKEDEALRRKRFASLRTWWMLAAFMVAGLLAGRIGIFVLISAASCVAWYELTVMFGARPQDRPAMYAGYAFIVVNCLLSLYGPAELFVVFLPVGLLILLPILLMLMGEPKGYIRSAGCLLWGLMFLGYGISHASYLVTLPWTSAGPAGPMGWFLFLVILTEANDIFQAHVGRRFGAHKRHRITPVISPNKTWEGFIGGMVFTVMLAPAIAPWLTTLGQEPGPFSLAEPLRPWVAPILTALLVAYAGFFGDINMSAIKRDSGVKDSGRLLPGMGGVIDRVDSLTMTAPVFVYFLAWWMA
jgi:phosphatidate cytidylyltransferase